MILVPVRSEDLRPSQGASHGGFDPEHVAREVDRDRRGAFVGLIALLHGYPVFGEEPEVLKLGQRGSTGPSAGRLISEARNEEILEFGDSPESRRRKSYLDVGEEKQS